MSDPSISSRSLSVRQGVDSVPDSAEQGILGTGRGPDGQAVEWQPSLTKSQSLPTGAGLGVSAKPITERTASAAPRIGDTAVEDDDGDMSDADSEAGIGTPPTVGSWTDETQADGTRLRSSFAVSDTSLLSDLSSSSDESDDDSDPGYRKPPPTIPQQLAGESRSRSSSVSSDDSLSLPPSPEEFLGAVSTDGVDGRGTLSGDDSDTTDYDENDNIRTDDDTLFAFQQVADDAGADPADRELAAKLVKEIDRRRNEQRRNSV